MVNRGVNRVCDNGRSVKIIFETVQAAKRNPVALREAPTLACSPWSRGVEPPPVNGALWYVAIGQVSAAERWEASFNVAAVGTTGWPSDLVADSADAEAAV